MKTFVTSTLAACILSLTVGVRTASADVTERKIEYRKGDAKLIGYVYSDEKVEGNAPGVLVFSDWMGVGPFAKERAKQLVGLGYRAFVADIYGDEKLATDTKEAGELAGKFKADRKLMRARAQAALETFLKTASVDPKRVGAIGFCFGGTVALELARDGAPLAGLVSFHGGLDTPDATQGKNIKGKVLALHGADDPYVPEKDVAAFEDEMRKGGVNWELVKYGNAVHAFTNPAAGTDNSKGAAYNAQAAKRAYESMTNFFAEIFKS
ncbi:MAG: dienelactone hydrolase family protein [Bdellovibrionota bacterium]